MSGYCWDMFLSVNILLLGYYQDIYWDIVRVYQYIFGISLGILYRILSGYHLDIFRILMGYCQYFIGIFSGYCWDIIGILLKHTTLSRVL